MSNQLSPLPYGFEYNLDLRYYVTPRLLYSEPIHRWYAFPHSFSPQLVDTLVNTYNICPGDRLLDPFVGAGTTILRAKQLSISATGSDLSPFSVFISKTKIQNYCSKELLCCLEKLLLAERNIPISNNQIVYPERILKAFTLLELIQFEKLRSSFHILKEEVKPFFILSLLKVQGVVSRAVPDGGWFRWIEKPDQCENIIDLFHQVVLKQIEDLKALVKTEEGSWNVTLLDARDLKALEETYDGVITSPPYPNRHDYSRIFHMELLSLGLSEEQVFELRHKSLRSHVEAHSPCYPIIGFQKPTLLQDCLERLPRDVDPRIKPMLEGYFEDLYLCLVSLHARLRVGAPCALVVGNVRHAGVMIPVDEILVKIGEQAGFVLDKAWVARLRGNSAQQMATYGREPSRETVIILKRL